MTLELVAKITSPSTWRAGAALRALYPMPLLNAIYRGMPLQQNVGRIGRDEMEEQRSSIDAITKESAEIPKTSKISAQTSKLTKDDGTVIPITHNPCQLKPKYVDD